MLIENETATRERTTSGSRGGGGRYSGGGVTSETVDDLSVQPASGSDLEVLEEGERERVEFKFYTKTDFRVTDNRNNLPGDVLVYEGERYKIRKAQEHRALLGGNKYLALREIEQ